MLLSIFDYTDIRNKDMNNFWNEKKLIPSGKIKPIKDSQSVFRDENTGARYKGLVGTRASLDAEPFLKVFFAKADVLASLSSAGMKVFFMIVDGMKSNKETSYLMLDKRAWEDYSEKMDRKGIEIGLNINTFYRGIKDLISKDVIRKGRRDGEYQVNPSIVFNGRRDKALKKEMEA